MYFFQKNQSLFCGIAALLLMVAGGMAYAHTMRFAFLFWNIFLAILPLYFSHKVSVSAKSYQQWLLAITWLLFFPNAAYLFTDIVHLHQSGQLLYWVDLMIIYLAGIYGIYISMRSLREMESWYGRFLSFRAKTIVTTALLLLCGYGIYLGRIERWNSWDVLTQPDNLLHALFCHSRHPFRNRAVWEMSGVFGIGMCLLYRLFGHGLNGKL